MKNFYDERLNEHMESITKAFRQKGLEPEHIIPYQWEVIKSMLQRAYELGIIDSTNMEVK